MHCVIGLKGNDSDSDGEVCCIRLGLEVMHLVTVMTGRTFSRLAA